MDNSIDSGQNLLPLSIDPQGTALLEETRKWAHFLSILGFIGIGIILLFALFVDSFMHRMMGSMNSTSIATPLPTFFLSALYVVFALIYFFPIYYLNRFAAKMKTALHNADQNSFNLSLLNLRRLFRFMGIVALIVLSIYLIVIISALIFGVFRGY